MRTYDIPRAKLARVLDGSQDFLLLKVGKTRLASIGEQICVNIVEGDGRAVDARCVFRARVVLTPAGLGRVLDARAVPEHDGLKLLFLAAEAGAAQAAGHLPTLAARDGFKSYEAMFAWHAAQQGGGGRGTLLREVIGWAQPKALRKAG